MSRGDAHPDCTADPAANRCRSMLSSILGAQNQRHERSEGDSRRRVEPVLHRTPFVLLHSKSWHTTLVGATIDSSTASGAEAVDCRAIDEGADCDRTALALPRSGPDSVSWRLSRAADFVIRCSCSGATKSVQPLVSHPMSLFCVMAMDPGRWSLTDEVSISFQRHENALTRPHDDASPVSPVCVPISRTGTVNSSRSL